MDRTDVRSYLATLVPHFHVCNGPRPGGHFLQSEAWPVNDMVLDHVARVVHDEC